MRATPGGVLITGASRGIGRSLAQALAGRGHSLGLVARQAAPLSDAVAALHAQWPDRRVVTAAADVTDPEAVAGAVHTIVGALGSLEGVVCNAGRAHPGYFQQLPHAVFHELCAVNYLGAIYTVHAALPHVRDGGFIVLTASVLGYLGAFGHTAYCGTKFALVGFAESLRQEVLDRRIHVGVLCPPDTDTPGYAAELPLTPPETAALARNAGLVHPDDVARACLRGLDKRQFFIHVTAGTALAHRAHRWFPSLTRAVMDRMVAKARRPARSLP